MEYVYAAASARPYECSLNPGDIIYFPDQWWHATINLDPYTVFVSTFTTEHDIGTNEL
jgi:ribosomal protein L16 Arg81 hydroxylase